MNTTVSAVYQQGILQLSEPLTLPDATTVQIEIHSDISAYNQSAAFHNGVVLAKKFLANTESNWSVDLIRQLFPQILRNELKTLWYLCQRPHRKLCAMLELSSMHLDIDNLNLDQVGAFRYGFDLLARKTLTDEDFDSCYNYLIDVGLPPRFTIGAEIVQSYIDES